MHTRRFAALIATGLFVAAACGGSDEGDGDGSGGSAGENPDGSVDGSSGSSGAGASGGASGGSMGGSSGSAAGGTSGGAASGGSGGSSGATGGSAGATGGSAGATGGSAGATGGSGGATGGSGGSAGGGPCVPILCQGIQNQCGDCMDNDGDGAVDMNDPDCLGPCHNSEEVYHNCIPGGGAAPCKVDCYFDKDTGPGTPPGNDGCFWNHECDPLEVAPSFDPEGPACAYNPSANTPGTSASCSELLNPGGQSQGCLDFCEPLTPNGCDCFGCCELPAGSGNTVYLGSTADDSGRCSESTCNKDTVNDPTKCRPCTQVQSCVNTCERCELCLGKDTLPPDCFPPPPDGGAGAGGTGGQGTGGTGGTGGSTGGTGGSTGGTGGSGGSGGGCPTPVCPSGVQACGLSCLDPCPTGFFCLTGCCIQIPQ